MYSEEYYKKAARVDEINREMHRLFTVAKVLDYLYKDIRPGTCYQWSNSKRVTDRMRDYIDKLIAELKEISTWIEANVESEDEGV